MNLIRVAFFLLVPVFSSGCVNYRVGHDIDNPTVLPSKTGKDCASMVWGLGFEPSREKAVRSAGIMNIRSTYDTNDSFFGIGRYCHVVVGE